jgi:hypothetical protein
VVKTIINHPFGNGKHPTYLCWKWGWFMALFYPHYRYMNIYIYHMIIIWNLYISLINPRNPSYSCFLFTVRSLSKGAPQGPHSTCRCGSQEILARDAQIEAKSLGVDFEPSPVWNAVQIHKRYMCILLYIIYKDMYLYIICRYVRNHPVTGYFIPEQNLHCL